GEGRDPQKITLRVNNLVIPGRSCRHAVQLVIDLIERGAGDLVTDVGACAKQACLAQALKRRSRRVSISLVFADIFDKPRTKHSAVDRVRHLGGCEVTFTLTRSKAAQLES